MSKSQKTKTNVFKQEEVLQAVVIADSFNIRFDPLTQRYPRCLLPLCNVPILHYVLSQLMCSGIQEVIVYCSSCISQIRDFIEKWNYSSQIGIKLIACESAQSLGDAMRDLDSRRLIHSDFVLLHGDLLSNLQFTRLLDLHKERRTNNQSAIMTMVMRRSYKKNFSDDWFIGYLPDQDNKIVHISQLSSVQSVDIAADSFISGIELRTDLLNIGVSLCSTNIPPLFQDNFDYDTIEDLVNGVIINEEIMNNSIHLEITCDFADRVLDMFKYTDLTEIILTKRLGPVNPEVLSNTTSMGGFLGPSNIYVSPDVKVPRCSVLTQNVLLGRNTTLKNNCTFNNCVIGENCKIGANVVLTSCILWDNISVEDDCRIENSLLANNVRVKKGSVIAEHSILSYDVIVGPKAKVRNCVLVASKGDKLPNSVVGKSNKAFKYIRKPVGESLRDSDTPLDDFSSDSENNDEDYLPIWTTGEKPALLNRRISDITSTSDDKPLIREVSNMKIEVDDPEELFLDEVRKTLYRGLKESVKIDNVLLELNSLKHAYNIPIEDLYFIFSKAIIEFPISNDTEDVTNSTEYIQQLNKLVKTFHTLLSTYLKSEEAKRLCLQAIEECACEQSIVLSSVLKVIHLLYDQDILSEEAILWWNTNSPLLSDDDLTEKTAQVRKNVMPFIKWLEEAEEESD